MEQRRRSFAKAFSWRITATFTTMLISWVITGSMDFAIKIGFFEFISKMVIYYVHERLWQNIKFGIVTHDYQI